MSCFHHPPIRFTFIEWKGKSDLLGQVNRVEKNRFSAFHELRQRKELGQRSDWRNSQRRCRIGMRSLSNEHYACGRLSCSIVVDLVSSVGYLVEFNNICKAISNALDLLEFWDFIRTLLIARFRSVCCQSRLETTWARSVAQRLSISPMTQVPIT